MWLDYKHFDDDFTEDPKRAKCRAKAIAEFAEMQQNMISKARKQGEDAEGILHMVESIIMSAILDGMQW
jgi:hypothetical protein